MSASLGLVIFWCEIHLWRVDAYIFYIQDFLKIFMDGWLEEPFMHEGYDFKGVNVKIPPPLPMCEHGPNVIMIVHHTNKLPVYLR